MKEEKPHEVIQIFYLQWEYVFLTVSTFFRFILYFFLYFKDFGAARYNINQRIQNLEEQCMKHSDPFRPESTVLTSKPSSFGSEVVYLHGKKYTASICIPHKVGSHAWGKFATIFNNLNYRNKNEQKQFSNLDFESRASQSVRVIVVRHPLERLLSVYQMIFENW